MTNLDTHFSPEQLHQVLVSAAYDVWCETPNDDSWLALYEEVRRIWDLDYSIEQHRLSGKKIVQMLSFSGKDLVGDS